MEITIKLEDDKEIRLKSLHFSDKIEDLNIYRFVPVTGGKVYFKIELNDSGFTLSEKAHEISESDAELTEKLEEWLVELNPNGQFTSESTEIDLDDESPYDPDKIRVDTKQFSLHQINEMIARDDINLSPDFQRNLVWDNKRKSRLIESVLMRIPLPMFYFAQDEEGRISVVDGLQRLSTVREFMQNKLRLRDLEYLQDKCGGRIYVDKDPKKAIDPKYFRWFNMTQITVNVIDASSPFKLKYDIFRRINTGGQPLNSQEIRNCLSSDGLRKALREMAKLKSFKEATGNSIKDVRMEAQELALRFILFYDKFKTDEKLNNYSGNIESELNTITETLSKDKKYNYQPYIDRFDNAMKNSYHLFGRYSFRKCLPDHITPNAYRQLINRALFISWSVLLSLYDYEHLKTATPKEALALPLAQKVDSDIALFQYLTYSTNSKVNIQAAFETAKQLIKVNLNL